MGLHGCLRLQHASCGCGCGTVCVCVRTRVCAYASVCKCAWGPVRVGAGGLYACSKHGGGPCVCVCVCVCGRACGHVKAGATALFACSKHLPLLDFVQLYSISVLFYCHSTPCAMVLVHVSRHVLAEYAIDVLLCLGGFFTICTVYRQSQSCLVRQQWEPQALLTSLFAKVQRRLLFSPLALALVYATNSSVVSQSLPTPCFVCTVSLCLLFAPFLQHLCYAKVLCCSALF